MPLRAYRADLHVHTCLSPCAEPEMTPRAIVEAAMEHGIDVIGICDHNAAANVSAVVRAAGGGPVAVIPGMEVTSREEVHVLALMETVDAALALEAVVQVHLAGRNAPEQFGRQLVVDDSGAVLGECSALLIGATDLSLAQVVSAVHGHGGCAVAAHVDRERFGLIGQLGFVPEDLPLDGLEHSPRFSRKEAEGRLGAGGRWEMVCGSDAHRLSEIGGGSSRLRLEAPTVPEIRLALRREGSRCVLPEE